jgi:hypothetical protein
MNCIIQDIIAVSDYNSLIFIMNVIAPGDY